MSNDVINYKVYFFGGPSGYQKVRAQIEVYEGERPFGYISFYDPEVRIPDDAIHEGAVKMNLPIIVLQNVLDILRFEKPVKCIFKRDFKSAILGSRAGEEPSVPPYLP